MMVSRRLLLVLACLLLVPTFDVHAQRALKSSQKRQVDKALKKMKEGTEAEKAQALRRIAVFGQPVHDYLLQIAQKEPSRSEVFQAMRKLDWIEGRDLEAKDVGGTGSPWSLWTIGTNEVILLKGLNRWTGLLIHDDYDPVAGTMTVTLAETDNKVLPLGGPGVKRETRRLTGKEIVLEGQASAFPTRDFTTKVMGSDVTLRSVGSQAFRYGLMPGCLPAARTGQKDMRRVRGGMKELVYYDRPPKDVAAKCRKTQQYLFRIVEGMEPLPTYGTSDEDKFAHAEQIQVEVRQERSGAHVLLIAFPHADESVPYDLTAHALLLAFVKRVFSIDEKDVLVWIGKNEAHETNWFMTRKGKWRLPSGRLRKRVRELFPEDY